MSEPVLRWPGSKWRISDWIISHFPAHAVYMEPFFGSGAVYFSKPPADTETINDMDGKYFIATERNIRCMTGLVDIREPDFLRMWADHLERHKTA